MRKGKGLSLIGYLFFQSHAGSWETGLRIDDCSIKGVSRVSNLIISLEENSNLYIPDIIFLGRYLVFLST
jgi:hypothetical protein